RSFSSPSRPRRISSRAVAPMPPAATKPSPSAPAATSGSFPRSFPATSVASPSPSRSSSTAVASRSRSVRMSSRTTSVVRPLAGAAIALDRLRGQLRLFDRLLRDRRCPLLDHPERKDPEQTDEAEERARDDERCARDDERIRPARAAPFRTLAELGAARGHVRPAGLFVRRGLALRPRSHQARLQLAQEVGVLRERLGELRLEPVLVREPLRCGLRLVRDALHDLVALRHFLVGGSSPVAIRQIRDAARRAVIVAAALRPAYNPLHNTFRSMHRSLPGRGPDKPHVDSCTR